MASYINGTRTMAVNTSVVEDIVIEQTTGDSETSVMSQKATTQAINGATQVANEVMQAVNGISETTGEATSSENSWTNGDVQVTGYKQYTVFIPQGKYLLNLFVTSSDTDVAKSAIRFYYDDNTQKYLSFDRNKAIEQTTTLAKDVVKVVFYAGTDATNSNGDTATYTNVSLRNIYTVHTAKDSVARGGVEAINEDVKYRQSANLFNGECVQGRYDYSTGKVYTGSSTHIRNSEPVAVDPNKGYNVAVKTEFRTGVLYVYAYDASMNFISKQQTTNAIGVLHFEGASFLNFHNTGDYAEKYPNEPLHIMVWESETRGVYSEWLEYGETSTYEKTKLRLAQSAMDDLLLPMHKARFDNSFNYIAYSQVTGSAGKINTAEHYEWAAKQGFTAIKGDVQPTLDGKLVMCHDNGFTLTSDGYITSYNADTATPIHDMTYAECLALQHIGAEQFNVCSFDQFIKICKKYGKIAFITVRDAYIDEVVSAMFAVLDKYKMRDRCIVNSFTLATLQAVREVDGTIMLSQVLDTSASITSAAIDRAVSLGNCMISGFDFPSFGRFDDITEDVIAYAKEKDIRLYQAQVNSMEDIDVLMEYGITGAQMTIAPTF